MRGNIASDNSGLKKIYWTCALRLSCNRRGKQKSWETRSPKNLRVVGSGFYKSAIRFRQGVGGVQDAEGKFGQDFLRKYGRHLRG